MDEQRQPRMTRHRKEGILVLMVLALAGCGGDDNGSEAATPVTEATAATTAAPAGVSNGDAASTSTTEATAATTTVPTGDTDGDGADYCAVAHEIDAAFEAGEQPSEQQLEAAKAAAPDQIAEQLTYVIDALIDRGFVAFGDDDVQEQFAPVAAYESEVCGIESTDFSLPDGVSTETDPVAEQVSVTATEYAFEFGAPNAGAVSFVMTNDGTEPHHMYILELSDGVTLDDVLADPDDNDLILFEAVSNVAAPREQAILTFENLPPGDYAMGCFIPDDDGVLHAYHGMFAAFTVDR